MEAFLAAGALPTRWAFNCGTTSSCPLCVFVVVSSREALESCRERNLRGLWAERRRGAPILTR
jgi:ferredoxin